MHALYQLSYGPASVRRGLYQKIGHAFCLLQYGDACLYEII